jgi:hypothetical protein
MLGNATAANTYEMDQLKLKSAELEAAESKLSQMRSKSYAITQTLNGNLKDNYVAMQNSNSVTGIASGIQSVFNGVLNTGNKLLQQRNNYVMLGNGAKSNLTATDQKYLTQLENEIALEKELDPIKRARIKAEQEAAAQGLSASGTTQYINQSVKLAEIQAKNDAASKSLTAVHKSEASAIKEASKSTEEYLQYRQELSRFNATEAQQIQNWQTDQLKQLDLYYAQGLVKAGEYEFGKQAIMAEANRRTKKLNDDQWSEYLSGSSAALLKLKQQAQTQLTGPKQQIVVSGIDKKLKEQTFSDLPTIDGGAQSNEQNQIAQLQTQTTAMNDAYNQRIEQYKAYRALEVENAAYYDSQIAALEKKKEENNKNAQAAMLNLQLSAGESMAASAADSFKSILGEQSAAYQTMFAVQKAFSIAQSMIAIQTGIAMAAANPWPLNIGAMASVAAATGSLISSIMSIASPSFDAANRVKLHELSVRLRAALGAHKPQERLKEMVLTPNLDNYRAHKTMMEEMFARSMHDHSVPAAVGTYHKVRIAQMSENVVNDLIALPSVASKDVVFYTDIRRFRVWRVYSPNHGKARAIVSCFKPIAQWSEGMFACGITYVEGIA